jgi:hypothetical protein
MNSKLIFENWRRFINEEQDLASKIVDALKKEGGAAGMDGDKGLVKHTGATEEEIRAEIEKMDNVGYHEEGDAVLAGGDIEIEKQGALDLGRGHGNEIGLQYKSGETMDEAEGEYATAAGMQQDLDMSAKRGDFEKGDYGNVGPGAGKMMDKADFPWIKQALEDLKDQDAPQKEQAVQALADELGINIKVSDSEDSDWYSDDHETFADLKFDDSMHQSFDDDQEQIDEQ